MDKEKEVLLLELEIIADMLIDWTLKSGEDVSLATVKKDDGIHAFTIMADNGYDIYKRMVDIR